VQTPAALNSLELVTLIDSLETEDIVTTEDASGYH
jgi:hypothetical protein